MLETNDLTVIKKDVLPLRVEFHKILRELPKNWRGRAAEINPFFATVEGFRAIQTVVNKRASLEKTRLVLEVAKQILLTPAPQPAQSPEPSAGGNLPQTQAEYRQARLAERNNAPARVSGYMKRTKIETL
jgi:hypothetical protein